jgi:hypothetical protein
MSLTSLSKIGLYKEPTWGSPGSICNLFPVNPPSLSFNWEQILDTGLRGINAKDFSVATGIGTSEIGLEGLCYPEEIGYLFHGILGGSALGSPGTSSPYTWTFSPADQQPSFSILDYPKIGTPGSTTEKYGLRYSGCLMSSLGIKFNAGEGAIGWTAAMQGKAFGTVDATSISFIGTPNAPLPGWIGSVAVGTYGSEAAYDRLIEGEFTFAREVVLLATAQKTQTVSFGYSGPLELTFKATVACHSISDILKYTNNTQEAWKINFSQGINVLQIYMPKVSYLDSPMEIDRGGVDVKLGMSMRALWDESKTEKICNVILTNAKASYAN